MGSGGKPAENVFRADLREYETFHRTVERAADHDAARLKGLCCRIHVTLDVGDVLDDLQIEHDIKFGPFVRQVFNS